MRRMIIDCDTGTDDAVAVMALLMAKDIDVIAITTVHGNIPAINSADNNLQIVDFLKKDVPVYVGCDRPIVKNLYKGRTLNTLTQTLKKQFNGEEIKIHEMDIGLCRHHRKIEEEHAVSFMVRTLKQATAPIDICAIGPLTNIAMALIMAPEIAKKIGTIFIMGGALFCGNRTPVGEANFVDDPEAAQIVLSSGANLMINPIEANKSGATYGLKDIEDIERLGNETAKFVGALLRKFIWRCGMLWDENFCYDKFDFPPESTCCIHDWAAVAPAIDMSTAKEVKRQLCNVDFSGGMSDGQLVIDRRAEKRANCEAANADIVYEMDEEKCKHLLLALLSSAR